MATVETARLYLRRLQTTDLDEYYQYIYADSEVMRTLPPFGPISRAEFDTRVPAFMVEHWAVHGFGPWAVIHRPDNQFIGHCGLRYWPGSSDVEVLYALARRYWGQGLATEGARASLRYGFEHLQLERIMAAALVDNEASRRVLEKIGLRYEHNFQFHGLAVASYSLSGTDYRVDDAQYRLVMSEDNRQERCDGKSVTSS
jgi:ribosomal-protein-alanine N-acetyltransferase